MPDLSLKNNINDPEANELGHDMSPSINASDFGNGSADSSARDRTQVQVLIAEPVSSYEYLELTYERLTSYKS